MSLFDFTTADTAVLFQDKPVVHRSAWVDLAAARAAEEGRFLALITPPDSALTLPANDLLSQPGRRWLVTRHDGRFHDGYTGRVHGWDGDAFTTVDELAEEFLVADARPDGALHLRADVMHPAAHGTRVGDLAETLLTLLTGQPPTGWGTHEPASEPWDVSALTDHCFRISPHRSRLVVVGAPQPGSQVAAVGVLDVQRTATGVSETFELLVEADDPLDDAALGYVGRALTRHAVRSALVGHALGLPALNRPARFTGASVPGLAVFGPDAVRSAGPEAARKLAGDRAELVGPSAAPSLVVAYDQQPEGVHPLEQHARLVQRLAG
ncbi:hypothetical protein GCM10011512_25050 [Tersicoccus solisilvae]|uniref:Uncharacterized protein n=1 Tax=Tersicoccus solisilvae TaxID=1882339 RepID=A0ABQ1PGQ4_9MICC|nr:DUF6177 family protein [Tersicoccus solisilvae]GGC97042.1 hypothetical protein GCM10011512_25050 [Tersicoccus solisilvae]